MCNKKLLNLFLTFMMLALVVVGCGQEEPAPTATAVPEEEIEESVTEPELEEDTTATDPVPSVELPASFISAMAPPDIPGGAPNATYTDAAIYAWQEFIAANWPAAATGRDMPDETLKFGDTSYTGPLVWETARHKVEIYPGQPGGGSIVDPNGYVDDASQDYGYDSRPPVYLYNKDVAPCSGTPSATAPWVNLDEITQIGQNEMFAGAADTGTFPEQLILFLAKANRMEYTYVVGNDWFAGVPMDITTNTKTYIQDNKASPPAGDSSLVSLPNGTIEFKTAWRRLTNEEAASGRFHSTVVRYYEIPDGATEACYHDSVLYNPEGGDNQDVWGMVALHIIHKTESAPYFIYATFGQADNILDAQGNHVETVDGAVNPQYENDIPMDPTISRTSAAYDGTNYTLESYDPTYNNTPGSNIPNPSPPADCDPQQRLYYVNTVESTNPTIYFGTPQGPICVNKRVHDIPSEIIEVNAAAHAAIQEYIGAGNDAPWLYYKLVNVQWKPVNKPAGEPYSEIDSVPESSYYQANIVVETNNNLQVFSGKFQPSIPESNYYNGLITDFQENSDGTYSPFFNTYYDGAGNNMGGCMGCHGNAQVNGGDFSFILAFPVSEPEAQKQDAFDTYREQLLLPNSN